jgi:hypothetical protein
MCPLISAATAPIESQASSNEAMARTHPPSSTGDSRDMHGVQDTCDAAFAAS